MKNKTLRYCCKVFDFILDLLFPKYCVGCGKEGVWICTKCTQAITTIQKPTCPDCQRLSARGKFCPRCRDKSFLTGLIVAAYYQEGPLREAIHTFKYEGVFDLGKDLGEILVRTINDKNLPKTTLIIPVPLYPRRQTQRGYNQAEILARQVSIAYTWPMIKNKLVRIKKADKTQVELSSTARRKNVKGIFSWRGKEDELKGKTILLVDDVYTTGATLQECAKILRRHASVKEIWGLVLAKA